MRNLIMPMMAALAFLLAGCDNFESHPYAAKIHGDTDIIAKNVAEIEAMQLKPPFKFAFLTDTQAAYNELEDAVREIRSRGDIAFVVHGGDMTDFGLPKEFVWCRDIMQTCGVPYVPVIGNHDCLGNGEQTYRYIFGTDNYSFNAGPVHFVMLNTIALEYDYSHPVPDFTFLTSDCEAVNALNAAAPGTVTHTVAVMHSRPFDEQFNNNVVQPFNYYLEQFPGMKNADPGAGTVTHGFCLCGHNHSFQAADLFDNGIIYWQCANTGKRQYFVITITDTGYEVGKIDF